MRRRITKDARGSKKTPKGNELEDLAVERVDAVDTPATGSPFLILKTADEDELRSNATDLIRSTRKKLKALKAAGVELTADQATLLNELAELVELDKGMFGGGKKPKKPMMDDEAKGMGRKGRKSKADEDEDAEEDEDEQDDEDGDDEEDEDDDEEEQPKAKNKANDELATTVSVATATAVTKSLAPLLVSLGETLTGRKLKLVNKKRRVERSAQPDDDDEQPTKQVKKHGEGLFTSAIFGD